MKRTILLFAGLCLFFSAVCDAFEGNSTSYYLDNGMQVIITEVPTSPVVAIYGLVKTGSATEGKYLGSGISHYLEHMLFKGTDRRGPSEVAGEIQALGGNINATTSKEYTNYTITVPYEHFDHGLDVLADMIRNAKIDEDEAKSEKEVIKSEMRLNNDNPRRFLHNRVFLNSYREHPYRHPTIGYPEIFEQITHKELYDYFKLHYSPNNMILSIAGNIKIEEIKPKIESMFGDFVPQAYVSHEITQEPPQLGERIFKLPYATNITRVVMTYQSVPLLHKDLYALDVLSSILGSGQTSRLYQSLYENKKLVYGIQSSNYTPKYPGMFEIEFSLEYPNLESAMSEIKKQIELIKEKGIDKKELEKVKRQSIADYVYYTETGPELAYKQVMDALYANDYRFSDKYVEGIKSVKAQDVVRVAKQYLIDDTLTTTVLYPEDQAAEDSEQMKGNLVGELQKFQLKNGVTVLLKENHMYDMISIRVALLGGLRYESEEVAGITDITQLLMRQGTKKYDFEDIIDLDESRGLIIGGFSGRNSFGFRFQFMPDDLDLMTDLMEQIIEHPTFPQDRLDIIKRDYLISVKNRKDNVMNYTREILNEELFKGHPYQWRQTGYEKSLNNITRDKIVEYYAKVVKPQNIVISVSGKFNSQEMLSKIRSKFEDMPMDDLADMEYHLNPITERKLVEFQLPKEQAAVLYGFRGVGIDHEDRYNIEVMTGILGSSFNGRMFLNIRDRLGKAYTLGGYDIPGINTGGIYFYVLTTEENVEKVQELLDKEIEDLQNNLVSDKELEDIKTYLKGSFDESIEKMDKLNYVMSLDEMYGLGAENYKQYKERIDSVTAQDVKEMARKYLDLNAAVVAVSHAMNSDEESN